MEINKLQNDVRAERSKLQNQLEIQEAQLNLKVEIERSRADANEKHLKRCEDELLRTKLSMQNQIDKDESYHRDEIAKLKSDFKKELKLKEDSLTNLKDQLQDVSALTKKASTSIKMRCEIKSMSWNG